MWTIKKIISGGQTGVDRAALEWALKNGIDCGGWCPAGRLAENGTIDPHFPLEETPSSGYSQRTEWNVRDSDGTIIFSIAPQLTGGTALTKDFASSWNRPCLTLSRSESNNPSGALLTFVDENRIETLNVAGPRESSEPEAGEFARMVLEMSYAGN